MIQHARFNLNDIAHEPSDEQLMIRLRAEMTAVDLLRTRA